MTRSIPTFAAAALLLSCSCSSETCDGGGACYYDYLGYCEAYVGEASLPHCSRSGGAWLEACPSEGLLASCLTRGTIGCPVTTGTYYYANYVSDLAYEQAMCSAQWATY